MQWNKLKSQVESFFCDSLKVRVELFTTWYKCGGSPERARGAILVDKNEIFEVNTDRWITLQKETSRKELWNQGSFQELEFRESLKEYLSLSIGEALLSENILIKALALIDRRVGKRKLLEIEIPEDEHQLVKFMYNLRCEADGIIKRINA
ncbi:hypothetical protein [Clostridium sp.]|uniref:SF0329 family protein n=1 Tax=Clostridium sp. TaxID=1506 RepID=UPI0028438835|nr:hypothetical protein [Clostridium sp.]MDR3596657.1 hypothetical protein [Clostridium sp.]